MRDLIVLICVFGSLPICFIKPHFGIYVWYWISLMNPHRLTWEIGDRFHIALIVAVVTLLGFLTVKHHIRFPKEREGLLLIGLMVWFTVTTVFGLFPIDAWEKWEQVMKILLMTVATFMIIKGRAQLRYLLIVITISIGFFALKGMVWGILTGGQFRLYGPPYSFIGDNNAMGMAFNMIIPITLFMARTENNWKVAFFYYIVFFSSIFGVVLTYSRGGVLGLGVVLLLIGFRMKKNVMLLGAVSILALLVSFFMPGNWGERIEGIGNYRKDASAMGRLETWEYAWRFAVENPLMGGGFAAFKKNPTGVNSHSIYFGMLAEHGFVGLVLFAALIIASYRSCSKMRKRRKESLGLEWNARLAEMLQISIISYVVTGAFLNLQYFDLFYCIVAIVIIMKRSMKEQLNSKNLQQQGLSEAKAENGRNFCIN